MTLLLTSAIIFSIIISTQTVSAQTTPNPIVTQFSLQYLDESYDTPSQTTSTMDPYTGQTSSTTTPSYHIKYEVIQVTIVNPPGATYYNFRYKGHYGGSWNYEPSDPNASLPYFISDSFSVPYKASTSSTTVCKIPLTEILSATPGGSIDIQVQALYGGFRAEPYVHVIDVGGPTYDFYFEGTTSDWSSTQTVTYDQSTSTPLPTFPESTSTPLPSVPELPATAILPLSAVIPFLAAIFIHKYAGKTTIPYYKKR
jgi:hypothetical protein